jgi:hypothetical protein
VGRRSRCLAAFSEWWESVDVATKYAQAAAETGQLAVSEEQCRDLLFATMDGALWRCLALERGWTDQRYADWLGRLWVSQLLGRP